MDPPPGFIDLDRHFAPLRENAGDEDSALESYVAGSRWFRSRTPDWEELLTHRLVVVLGEAGSGKTFEMRNQAASTRRGRFSFLLRLDELAEAGDSLALGVDETRLFHEWRNSAAPGVFFLDSVDEAKMQRPTDFYRALDRFRDAIGSAVSRATIVISSRVTGWLPTTDAHEVRVRFPALVSGVQQRRGETEPRTKQPLPFVVQLLPLDERAVRKYAIARNVEDSDAFLQALDTALAWDFARRPSDVDDLFSFWRERRTLGTLSEILAFICDRQLRKTSDRDVVEMLSLERARQGAEALAAATVLCRRFTFAIPGDTTPADGTLDALACLPEDWRPEEGRALLARAIFDGASYGRIRFHHRRLSEFLAAAWFRRLMQLECPIAELEAILTEVRGGRRILRPSMAPIAAWLSLGAERWQQQVFRWVLQSAPQTLLRYGDPAMLPLADRRALLYALAKTAENRDHLWWERDRSALMRLAHPDLAPDINALLLSPETGHDLRVLALELVATGRLAACSEAVLQIAERDMEDGDLFSYATRALEVVGHDDDFRKLAERAQSLSSIPARVGVPLAQMLFPHFWGVEEFIAVLRRVRWDRSSRWDYVLQDRVRAAAKTEGGANLIHGLLGLPDPAVEENAADEGDFDDRAPPVNVHLAIEAALGLLSRSRLTAEEEAAIGEAIVRGDLRGRGRLLVDREAKQLADLSKNHPGVRRQYFQRAAAEIASRKEWPNPSLFNITIFHEAIPPIALDFGWLLEDITNAESAFEREQALLWALQLWQITGRSADRLRDLRRATKSSPELRRILWRSLHPGAGARWRAFRNRHVRLYRVRYWFRNRLSNLRRLFGRVRDRWKLWRYRRQFASGERVGWLAHLVWQGASRGSDSHYISLDWSSLTTQRGIKCARAVRAGCKLVWRRYDPALPHQVGPNEGPDNGTLVGLAGLLAGWQDGDLDFSLLSEPDACRAARYALREMNGFAPWFSDLARAQPNAVRSVLSDCVAAEWEIPANDSNTSLTLFDLAWTGEDINPLIRDDLFQRFVKADPANHEILRHALGVLLHPSPPEHSLLAGLAQSKIEALPVGSRSFSLWAALWLQTDALAALECLERRLTSSSESDTAMMRICSHLSGEPSDQIQLLRNPSFLGADAVQIFVPLVFNYVRPKNDIVRHGSYTPGGRDYAQRFRDALFEQFAAKGDPSAEAVLRSFLDMPELTHIRDYIRHVLDKHIEQLADGPAWAAAEVRGFARDYERDPQTDKDLFQIGLRRLADLKAWVERGEDSPRDEVRPEGQESGFRRWLQRRLNERARGRYVIPQEWEIDGRARPDLRLTIPGVAPVSLELKIADNWSLQDLIDGLEQQLVGTYMRDQRARYGIYVLAVFKRRRTWKALDQAGLIDVESILQMLRQKADAILAQRPDLANLEIVVIHFEDHTPS
jgi:hypothetical protein